MFNTLDRKSLRFVDIVFVLMGIFATMPIVCLRVADHFISFFTIFFCLSLIALFCETVLNRKLIKIEGGVKLLIAWLCMAIFSSICGYVYFASMQEWKSASVSYLPKLILYILFALLWGIQKKRQRYAQYMVKGLLIGCVLNLMWTIIDASGFYVFGESITNNIFKTYAEYAGTRFGTPSLIINGMIRSGGFNDDPAHIGFIAPIVAAYAVYAKKGWLLMVVVGAIIGSASTTALLCVVLILIFNIKGVISIIKKRRCAIVIALPIITVVMIGSGALSKLNHIVGLFLDRILSNYGSLQSGGERGIYIRYIFQAVRSAGATILFGTGIGTASHAYVFNSEVLKLLGEGYSCTPYDIEINYLTYLFDLGIIGVVLYIAILYRFYRSFKKDCSVFGITMRAFSVGIILSAFFYHYTLMAMQMLMIIVATGSGKCKRIDNLCLKNEYLLQQVPYSVVRHKSSW